MIVVMKLCEKYYARNININSRVERENIKILISEGGPIILANNLADLKEFGIEAEMIYNTKR
jgi:hypothetical protein